MRPPGTPHQLPQRRELAIDLLKTGKRPAAVAHGQRIAEFGVALATGRPVQGSERAGSETHSWTPSMRDGPAKGQTGKPLASGAAGVLRGDLRANG